MASNASTQYPQRIAHFRLGNSLGSGVSGSTFYAVNTLIDENVNGNVVALKVQPVDISYPTNGHERTIYPLLQGGPGMPKLWASGVWERKWDWLAIDLLGSSLDSLYRKSGKGVMPLGSVVAIAVQLITRLEFMHSRGVLHRDIQLGNIVVGLVPQETTLYMIDFGFSKRYLDARTRRHVKNRTEEYFIGNYWFSSVNVHCRGKTCSRRDDLEAAALMLIHLLTPGGLSWTRNGVPKDDAAHDRLKREKRDTRPEDLCRGLPEEFEGFLRYCRSLSFTANPDYAHWRDRFRDLAQEQGLGDVERFIWPPPAQASARPATAGPSKYRQPSQRPANPDMVENVLQDLARMNLGRPVLGDKKNIQQNGNRPEQLPVKEGALILKKPSPAVHEVIVISSDDDSRRENAPVVRHTKALRISRLTRSVAQASDNHALAGIVKDFAGVLTGSSSRTLTREGFAFLDALHKQLADPSVFIVPLRSRSARSEREAAAVPLARERRSKLGVLRASLGAARDNKTLARLVAEFGSVVDKTTGRKLTKDGLAFLEGIAERLRVV
ncbi:kinase-like protein [Auriscalpium vulgare]|uniref:Kinase-like protein n=1 Tax=Auriscalpium vulgare TaxID=40419 RepID=A0ACB8S5C5_9AGAM|nr:kinase-like protein [Auriscalpium vulgare]